MDADAFLRSELLAWDDLDDASDALAHTLLKIDNGYVIWKDGNLVRAKPSESGPPAITGKTFGDRKRSTYRYNLWSFKLQNIDYLCAHPENGMITSGFMNALGNQFLNDDRKCVLETVPTEISDRWQYLLSCFHQKLVDFVENPYQHKHYPLHLQNAIRIGTNFEDLPICATISDSPVVAQQRIDRIIRLGDDATRIDPAERVSTEEVDFEPHEKEAIDSLLRKAGHSVP